VSLIRWSWAPGRILLAVGVLVAAFAAAAFAPAARATVRAAFYYPWFPETWGSGTPFTNYHPSLGYYDSSAASVIQQHVRAMQYGGIEAGIASRWGPGTKTDNRISTILSTTSAMGSGFRWTLYYEDEGHADPSASQIATDLSYIATRYASDPSYLRLGGKPVLFVYGGDSCAGVDRWRQGNGAAGFHIVLKVFSGYRSCPVQPDGWHQYSPAAAVDSQAGYSISISPGFNKFGEPELLPRDLGRWTSDVARLRSASVPWQLVTTFNEWGEGTAVESAREWQTASGYGAYLDVLGGATSGVGAGGGGGAGGSAGKLTALSLSPRAFLAARSGPALARRAGTTVRYVLSAPATVQFRIRRRLSRGQARRRCASRRRARPTRHCTRYGLLRGELRRTGKAGVNRLRFRGRLRGRRLRAGRSQLLAAPLDGAGHGGRAKRAPFRILRAR
jgi:hypothetical protein